jgi:putative Mg2+ transporter-C (MgtC) family protein
MVKEYPWLGDLHGVGLGEEWVGLICIFVSMGCGALVGTERERRDKPAGLRTVILISVGSTIFTMVSLLLSSLKTTADPARLAAQIIPGIGFLGAGAIIHARGTVLGLTTGATIWAVSAVGVTIGAGYVVPGVCFTLTIYFTLSILHRFDWIVVGRCKHRRAVVSYRPDNGRALPLLQEVIDRHRLSDTLCVHGVRHGDERQVEIPVCVCHRHHRIILKELAEIHYVTGIEVPGQHERDKEPVPAPGKAGA